MILNKKQILAATALKTKTVPLPEGGVIVSEITADDYLEICTLAADGGIESADAQGNVKLDMKKFNAALMAYSIVDAKGARIFDDSDIPLLIKRSQKSFSLIMKDIKELNGLTGTEGNASEPTKGGSSTGE